MTLVDGRGTREDGIHLSWRALAWPAAAAAPVAIATAYITTHNPHVAGATFVCPLYAATGLYCPGCGGTRAVYDLVHLDVASAIAMNPLLTLAIPLILALWARWILRGQGVRLREWPFPAWLGGVLGGVIVAFAVLRNFGPLAPYLAP